MSDVGGELVIEDPLNRVKAICWNNLLSKMKYGKQSMFSQSMIADMMTTMYLRELETEAHRGRTD